MTTQQAEQLERPRSTTLDDILGKPFKVLNDGFVRLVDYMGNDASIVQAARVSYGEGTKKVHEDRGLIRYLMRHRHSTPFEMCEAKFHVRVPMDAWRQWIRHRTANVNEYSTRYSVAITETQRTEADQWRKQAEQNRQGSAGYFSDDMGKKLSDEETKLIAHAHEVYQNRLDQGVAREQARKDLPLSTYTEAYWKVDLHNLLHFLALRMDSHAQLEIRDYATCIGEEIVKRWVPLTWEAFVDYRFDSMQLTRIDHQVIAAINEGGKEAGLAKAKELGIANEGKSGLKRNRERDELSEKLKQLGLIVPWE